MTPRVCKRALVSGRVQGVFYRATAARQARSLGVEGYARNLADGRVEVLACGDEGTVDEFLRWLWVGSSASRVEAVEIMRVESDAAPVAGQFVSR